MIDAAAANLRQLRWTFLDDTPAAYGWRALVAANAAETDLLVSALDKASVSAPLGEEESLLVASTNSMLGFIGKLILGQLLGQIGSPLPDSLAKEVRLVLAHRAIRAHYEVTRPYPLVKALLQSIDIGFVPICSADTGYALMLGVIRTSIAFEDSRSANAFANFLESGVYGDTTWEEFQEAIRNPEAYGDALGSHDLVGDTALLADGLQSYLEVFVSLDGLLTRARSEPQACVAIQQHFEELIAYRKPLTAERVRWCISALKEWSVAGTDLPNTDPHATALLEHLTHAWESCQTGADIDVSTVLRRTLEPALLAEIEITECLLDEIDAAPAYDRGSVWPASSVQLPLTQTGRWYDLVRKRIASRFDRSQPIETAFGLARDVATEWRTLATESERLQYESDIALLIQTGFASGANGMHVLPLLLAAALGPMEASLASIQHSLMAGNLHQRRTAGDFVDPEAVAFAVCSAVGLTSGNVLGAAKTRDSVLSSIATAIAVRRQPDLVLRLLSDALTSDFNEEPRDAYAILPSVISKVGWREIFTLFAEAIPRLQRSTPARAHGICSYVQRVRRDSATTDPHAELTELLCSACLLQPLRHSIEAVWDTWRHMGTPELFERALRYTYLIAATALQQHGVASDPWAVIHNPASPREDIRSHHAFFGVPNRHVLVTFSDGDLLLLPQDADLAFHLQNAIPEVAETGWGSTRSYRDLSRATAGAL